ncbi:hypothetical protein A1O3_08204 [Capronia epimyces CBS 606.96]|uniref:Cytochrome P450 oxidoreductase n=1 Tax=Capronia epimyces CBS 606.96 TaxID=1182542 RepID=W9YC65_9EURO|nr:uncharacterized protein A1O3_08204 [Capronia epimyces CBS 606.96]EXJ79919.1 hypothetical protein A1O3_08204 [Capronia epimyces CBS 606.96]
MTMKMFFPWYLALLATVVLLVRILRIGRRPRRYPPGPPTIPILGNLHQSLVLNLTHFGMQMPSKDVHKQFQRWSAQYGPVFSLILGTTTMVVLSSDVAVKEVLDKRSAVTNERGDHYVGHRLLTGGEHMLLMPNGPKWRLQRKLFQKMLNLQVTRTYLPYVMLENKQMLVDLIQKPDDFIHHIKRYSNSLITTMAYGRRTPSSDDPTLIRFLQGLEDFTTFMQSSTAALMDVYPVLRRLPAWMTPITKDASEHQKRTAAFYVSLWLETKAKLAQGTAKPCFCVDLLLAQKQEGFTDQFGAYLAGAALEAGTDTTGGELCGFVKAMVLFPAAQHKAQAELDRVVGDNRLPTIDDLPRLPYLRACVKETLRWMPTAIMGAAPHAAKEDIQYMGYTIPAGAMLINNVYTIHHDPGRYAHPHEFDPDRYEGDLSTAAESAQNADVAKRDHFVFGAGRRLCAGIHLAEQSIFLAISRMLWTFDISPKLDPVTNSPILPEPDRYTQAVVCMPEPFEATFTPRSQRRVDIVMAEWREAQNELDEKQQWRTVGEGMKFSKI